MSWVAATTAGNIWGSWNGGPYPQRLRLGDETRPYVDETSLSLHAIHLADLLLLYHPTLPTLNLFLYPHIP